MDLHSARIAIVGLGYVGLPLAVEFGKLRPVVGFDINPHRIAELQAGRDSTLEVEPDHLAAAKHLQFASDPAALAGCQVFIVTVPTPVDQANRPDLTPLVKASETVGRALKRGDVVVYESTVYPGATEEVCVPVLEKTSGLHFNTDFFCGYSPERINPGDKEHRLPTIKKVTSGSTPEVADAVDAAPRGRLIRDSEEPVRDAVGRFRTQLFQRAMQQKVNAAEAAFPPSAQRQQWPANAAQGPSSDQLPDQ